MSETDWLSPLMCINIGVLFGIIQAIRVWCDIMVGAADINNNGGNLKYTVTGFKDMAV